MQGKDAIMVVGTVEELFGAVNHNFRFLEKRIGKLLRKNRRTTVLALAAVGLAVWSELERRKQEEQLYQLSVRVKKLEYGKGE